MFSRSVSNVIKFSLCLTLLCVSAFAQRRQALRELKLATGETVVVEQAAAAVSTELSGTDAAARRNSNTPQSQTNAWRPLSAL